MFSINHTLLILSIGLLFSNWKFFARADGYSDDDEAVQALEGRDEDTSYENTYLSQDTGEKSNAEDPDSNDGDSPSNDEPDESSDSSSGDEVQTIEEEYSSSNDDDQSSGNGHVFDEPNEDAERPEEEDLSEIEGSGFHDVDSFPNAESDDSSDSSSGDEVQTIEEEYSSSNDDDQSSGDGHVFDEPNEDAERPEEEDLSEIEGSGFHDVDSFPNAESDDSSDSSSGDEKQTAEEVANSSEAPGSSPDDRSSESEVDGGPQVDESETGEAVNAEKEERTVDVTVYTSIDGADDSWCDELEKRAPERWENLVFSNCHLIGIDGSVARLSVTVNKDLISSNQQELSHQYFYWFVNRLLNTEAKKCGTLTGPANSPVDSAEIVVVGVKQDAFCPKVSKKQFIRGIPGECTADDYDGKLHGLQIATYQIQMESSVSSSQLFAQLKKPNTHGNNCRFNGYLQ